MSIHVGSTWDKEKFTVICSRTPLGSSLPRFLPYAYLILIQGVCLDKVGGDDMRHCAPWPTSRAIRYATPILNLSLLTMENGSSIF